MPTRLGGRAPAVPDFGEIALRRLMAPSSQEMESPRNGAVQTSAMPSVVRVPVALGPRRMMRSAAISRNIMQSRSGTPDSSVLEPRDEDHANTCERRVGYSLEYEIVDEDKGQESNVEHRH
jgi:hypothetical protein